MLVNLYATHRNPPPLEFPHQLNSRRDRSDEALAEHLRGFAGYIFQKGGRKMTAHLYHLLQHVERVQHHLSLWVNEDDDLEGFCEWAKQANAIVFYQDGAVRDDYGLRLLDPRDGSRDPDAVIPFLPDAYERKARSLEELARMGVVSLPSLPPTVSEHEVLLRTPDEVARRALALLVVALRAESIDRGDPWPVPEMRKRFPEGFAALSGREKLFLVNDAPDRQAVIDGTWRYEALALLLWALGLVDELTPPVGACDPRVLAEAATAVPGDALVANARLRAVSVILDAADLHYRLHWAVRQAEQIDEREPPGGLTSGVVAERRYALNWLVRHQDAEWDRVQTPT